MAITLPDPLKAEIDERIPELIATRRDFHEHPELAFEEVRTSSIVAERLRALGLEVQTNVAKTGVVATLHGGAPGKTLALRADMDALPILEENTFDFRSQVDGKMHACGHDGHTAILLTVAEILTKQKEQLKGSVRFIFQPAEERIGGAKPMVEQGALTGVDHVMGLHLWSPMPTGKVGVQPGPVFASAAGIRWTIRGKGGHAAAPHTTVDPVLIAAQTVVALQTLVSRESNPFQPTVLTVAKIEAGTAFNIIPESVEMLGTMRTFSADHHRYMLRRIKEVSQGIASTFGGSSEIEIDMDLIPCVNDPEVTSVVHAAAVATVGAEHVLTGEDAMTTGADDMAIMLDTVPGCYFLVGAAPEKIFPHHHPRFDINEDALPIAAEILIRSVQSFLS